MVRSIHSTKLLPKQLRALRNTGKKAELAANRCEEILNDIKKYGCRCESVLSKRTRYGELRMKNCVKYHLGSGYRLVTVKADGDLFICFVGNHDETDQWIDNHRNEIFSPGDPLYICEKWITEPDIQAMNLCEDSALENLSDPYEDQLMAKLDESLLKSIFQGLFANSIHEQDVAA
jgi:hypothetical protein